MDIVLLQELDTCLELCSRLERLFQQDIDEITLSVTGEIHCLYTDSREEAMHTIKILKEHIMLLHSQAALL